MSHSMFPVIALRVLISFVRSILLVDDISAEYFRITQTHVLLMCTLLLMFICLFLQMISTWYRLLACALASFIRFLSPDVSILKYLNVIICCMSLLSNTIMQ